MQDIIAYARAVLEITPQRWLNLTKNLPVDLLMHVPKAGEWTAVDCLLHLLDAERGVFPPRVGYLLAGQDFPAFDPDSEGTQAADNIDPRALAQEFADLRQESLHWFDKITAADLNNKAQHSELGLVTLGELLHEWAGHDLMHTVQAERALMQPFIAGSGPWQVYFSDHWAGE